MDYDQTDIPATVGEITGRAISGIVIALPAIGWTRKRTCVGHIAPYGFQNEDSR